MSWKNLLFKPAPDPTMPPASDGISLSARLRAVAQQSPTPSLNVPPAAVNAVTVADPEFTKELTDAIGKSTKPGFAQFAEQVELLRPAIADEATRLKIALATTAQFLKVTPEQIIAAIQERADLLVAAKDDFERDVQTEVDQRTTTYNNHLADLDIKLQQNEAERQRLSADKIDTQRQLGELHTETEMVRTRFAGAFRPLHDHMTAMLQRLR